MSTYKLFSLKFLTQTKEDLKVRETKERSDRRKKKKNRSNISTYSSCAFVSYN